VTRIYSGTGNAPAVNISFASADISINASRTQYMAVQGVLQFGYNDTASKTIQVVTKTDIIIDTIRFSVSLSPGISVTGTSEAFVVILNTPVPSTTSSTFQTFGVAAMFLGFGFVVGIAFQGGRGEQQSKFSASNRLCIRFYWVCISTNSIDI
jgi:hypothetical protein